MIAIEHQDIIQPTFSLICKLLIPAESLLHVAEKKSLKLLPVSPHLHTHKGQHFLEVVKASVSLFNPQKLFCSSSPKEYQKNSTPQRPVLWSSTAGDPPSSLDECYPLPSHGKRVTLWQNSTKVAKN